MEAVQYYSLVEHPVWYRYSCLHACLALPPRIRSGGNQNVGAGAGGLVRGPGRTSTLTSGNA